MVILRLGLSEHPVTQPHLHKVCPQLNNSCIPHFDLGPMQDRVTQAQSFLPPVNRCPTEMAQGNITLTSNWSGAQFEKPFPVIRGPDIGSALRDR